VEQWKEELYVAEQWKGELYVAEQWKRELYVQKLNSGKESSMYSS